MLGVRSQIFLKTFKVYVDFNFVQWREEGNLDKAVFKHVNCRLLTNIPYQREERRGKCPKPFWPGLQFWSKCLDKCKIWLTQGRFCEPTRLSNPHKPLFSLKPLNTKPHLGRCYIVTTKRLGHLVFYIWSVHFQVISLPWTVLGVTSKNVWKIFQSVLTSNLFEWGEKPRQSNFELPVTLEFLQKLKEGNGKCPKPFWPGLWVW